MKALAIAGMLLASASLASCVTTGDAKDQAAKVYNTVCIAEPPIYVVVSAYGGEKNWSPSKLNKLDQAHAVVNRLCTDRPDDLLTGLVALTNAYRDVLALKAQTES